MGDSVAVDREALADAIREGHDMFADSGREGCWANAQKIADYILQEYPPDEDVTFLVDAAAVRHEHGERIVKALRDDHSWPYEWRALAARIVRDLSPAPGGESG